MDDGDILGLCSDVGFLEAHVSVAFLSGNEAGGHLHAGGTEVQDAADIGAGEHAAASDDRHVVAAFVFEFFCHLHYGRNNLIEGKRLIRDFVFPEAEVSAGHGAFNHEAVRHVIEMAHPLFGQNGGGPCG